jgi:hypothetical protein
MKIWLKKQWLKFKKWILGILAAVGLISAPLLMAIPTEFTYTRATEYTDGTPMPLSDIAETRIYCGGSLVASEAGADGTLLPDLGIGVHTCYATHVDIYGRESDPSNEITTTVVPPGIPVAPVLDTP